MENKIKIFAGYQFVSDYYDRAELDAAINWACETAESDLSGSYSISIEYYPIDISCGNILLNELSKSLHESSICIFEVSEINDNVFFELGIAHALKKPVILLVSSTINRSNALPSDLHGIVYLKYKNIGQLRSRLSKEILGKAKNILENGISITNFLDHIWMQKNTIETVIVGEDIVSVNEGAGKKDVYYVHSGDALAIIEAQVNYAYINKEMRVLKLSSKEIKGKDLDKNLILIGGPNSNELTKRILKEIELPWQFDVGTHTKTGKCIKHRTKNRILTAKKNHSVRQDYCMIFFGPNPFNLSTNVTLFAGLHNFGVVGAVRALSPTNASVQVTNNVQSIIKRGWRLGKQFQVVAPVSVINLDPAVPAFSINDIEIIDV